MFMKCSKIRALGQPKTWELDMVNDNVNVCNIRNQYGYRIKLVGVGRQNRFMSKVLIQYRVAKFYLFVIVTFFPDTLVSGG